MADNWIWVAVMDGQPIAVAHHQKDIEHMLAANMRSKKYTRKIEKNIFYLLYPLLCAGRII
jgi:hypothetical protein